LFWFWLFWLFWGRLFWVLIIPGLPAKLHGTSAQGAAHLQCAPSSALSTTGSFASGLVIVE
jgi:hypothetical protein